MYLTYFQLQQAPFSIAPDPHVLFMSRSHREALAHLLYGVESGGGFVLLTGEIGAGKTTICRCFLEQVPAHCDVAYVFNPRLSVEELLRTVCDEFGVSVNGTGSVKDHVDALNAFLLASHAQGRHCILIIDEAQNLSADVLEQLRLLTNLETHTRKLLQIILIGQPELRALVAQPRLEQLAQRIIARYHLGALDADETAAYVRQRLLAAGATGPGPFGAQALRLVHRLARGIPRRINLLCDRALLGAYARQRQDIDGALLREAAHEVFGEDRQGRRARLRKVALFGTGLIAAGLLAAAAFLHQPPAAPATLPEPPGPPSAAQAPAAQADLGASLPQLARQEAAALRQLLQLWNVQTEGDDPCAAIMAKGVQCYRSQGGLAELRALDRPAVLLLDDGSGTRYAVLTGMDADTVTLAIDGASRRFPAKALAAHFHGSFISAWRAPADFSGAVRAQDDSDAVRWVGRQLGLSDPGAGAASQSWRLAFVRALREFQQAQGLRADGVAGARTLMALNRLAGVPEPRLANAADSKGN